MLYTKEDLPGVVDTVRQLIHDMGHDPNKFEIDPMESGPCVRVAIYTDDGGFMVRLYSDKNFSNLKQEILDFLGESK